MLLYIVLDNVTPWNIFVILVTFATFQLEISLLNPVAPAKAYDKSVIVDGNEVILDELVKLIAFWNAPLNDVSLTPPNVIIFFNLSAFG